MRILKLEHHHFDFDEARMPLTIHQKIILAFVSFNLITTFYLELFHFIVGIFHLLFEYAEEALDLIVEHLFETGTHETQVIVFYILAPAIFFLCYFSYRLFFPKLSSKLQHIFRKQKHETLAQWHALPLLHRFAWWTVFALYIVYLVFFSF